MKQIILSIIILFLSTTTRAYDIAVENEDGVTIYYNYINNGMELEVTKGSTPYSGVVNIPETVLFMNRTRNVTSIAKSAFEECTELRSVIIPDGVKTIGDNTFHYCWYLTSVSIPHSVTIIGDYAFSQCVRLSSVHIPNSVTSIGKGAFQSCQSLTSIALPYGITSINDNTFDGCGGIVSISIPSSVTTIGKQAFIGCKNIISIDIPNSVSTIGKEAFLGCSKLTTLTIPNSVVSIENYAFSECAGLASVTIGKNVTSMGRFVFYNVDIPIVISLNESPIDIYGKSSFNDVFSTNTYNNATLYVPEVAVEKYKTTEGWKDFLFIEPISSLESRLFKLTYKIDDEIYKVLEIYYGADIMPEEEPERVGYSFSGWSEIPKTMPANDVTVTGSYTVNTYTLTYMVDGEEYKTCQVDYGTTIIPEAVPTMTGYTFSGWSDIPETMPANDVTISGSFTVNTYTLTYMVDDELYKASQVDYGAAITPEAAPTMIGHTFSGWSEIPETMPDHDVIVTGSFTVNKYQVTYIIDGEMFSTEYVEYGATIVPPSVEDKEEFTSFGWTNVPETMPAHDLTIYGSFTSGIAEIVMATNNNVRIYSPNGKKIDKMQKGLNIVVLEDGTVKKIIVK